MPIPKRKAPLLSLMLAAGLALHGSAAVGADSAPFVPTFESDFPDPFILLHGGRFLAYATNTDKGRENVQMATSTDLVTWKGIASPGGGLHDAMPELPKWAKRGNTWAPEVLKTDKGFVLYFTARDEKSDLQCVGAAFSADPLGPFVSTAPGPLVCQTDLGGTIDASPFRDGDGQLYLYYKNDGNNPRVRKPTDIFVQRLSPDGLSLAGEPVALLRNDKDWEAHVIEAPTMVKTPSGYTMLYSANHFGWETHQRLSPYAMGYATCSSPMGPCKDASDNPILYSYNNKEAGCLSGPGHQTVFQVGQRSFIAFHGWLATKGCRKVDDKRVMYVAPLAWKDGKPVIAPSLRPAGKD